MTTHILLSCKKRNGIEIFSTTLGPHFPDFFRVKIKYVFIHNEEDENKLQKIPSVVAKE